jgi:hypothetical protein
LFSTSIDDLCIFAIPDLAYHILVCIGLKAVVCGVFASFQFSNGSLCIEFEPSLQQFDFKFFELSEPAQLNQYIYLEKLIKVGQNFSW